MGSLGGIMRLMPGVTKEMRSAAANVDERELDKVEAIISLDDPARAPRAGDHRRVAPHAHRARRRGADLGR